jgi:hypothetical protein
VKSSTFDNHTARFRNAFDKVQRVARGEKPLWVVPELAELAKQRRARNPDAQGFPGLLDLSANTIG